MAAAPAFQPFTIRGFAASMRAADASKCWPFGSSGDGESPPPRLPPMEPPKRSRWWAHELAAERARLESSAAGIEAVGGGDSGKGTKRKGSLGRVRAERARKRRRSLQFGLLSKRKEKSSKPQSTSRLLRYVLHMQLLRKHQGSTMHTERKLSAWNKFQDIGQKNKFQDTQDCMSSIEDNLSKLYIRGMNPCIDKSSSLVRKKLANPYVNKPDIKDSEPTNYPLNLGCEFVKSVTYSPKDDIFGDLPLLECPKIMFQTGVDELPTVIEDSFVTDQSVPDAISENVSLKLVPSFDMPAQTSSTPEDLVKKEGTPGKKSICISHNDAKKSKPSAVFDGLNHSSINMVKTCLGDNQLKSPDVPSLSPYFNKGLKSGSTNIANTQQGCFSSMNTNYRQEITRPGNSSSTSSVTVRTRTETIESDRDSAVNGKKSTDVSCALVPIEYHISSEGSVLSSAISQGSASAANIVDGMSSCKRVPSQDSIPTSGIFGNFASNVCHENRNSVHTCMSLSKEDWGSLYSKVHPVCTPANIGSAFMKLPGLERIEMSSCHLKTDENRFTNGQPANIVRCKKQQVVTGVPNIVQCHIKTDFRESQVREKVLNGYLQQDVYCPCQPTVRLMGKTVSVCEGSKDHRVSTIGKVWTGNTIIENHPSSTSHHFGQKKLFLCQDSMTPSSCGNGSNILQVIPSATLPEARATVGNVPNQRLKAINNVASTVRDGIWNSGSQFVPQADAKKATPVSVNSRARYIDLHQPQPAISTSQNHYQLNTSSPILSGKDYNYLRPAVTQSSSFPQGVLNTGMQERYRKSTLFSYDDPSSAPIYQSCKVPGTKLSSTPIISVLDYGADNAELSKSLPQVFPSLATNLPVDFLSTVTPTCTVKPTNISGRKGAVFANQRNKRPAYVNNGSHEPAKKLMVNKHDLTAPMIADMKNHSLGWSLDDAVGPRILDFGKVAGHVTEMSTNGSNNILGSSGPVPVLETRSRTGRSIKPPCLSLAIYTFS
uniref:Uncharacterized protein n=1 Tax=Leersia perrieri TaxID=77586 RepID=A0A0D9V584_9ORYZ